MITATAIDALTVIVPILPPSANHMYATGRNGAKFLTEEAQAFRAYVAVEARTVARMTGWQLPAGRLAITIKLTYGTRARTDIDNRAKSAIDSMALALGFDDSRIDRVVIERAGYDQRRPLCEMILEEWV